MARTNSTMLALGTRAPDFTLTDAVSGRSVSLQEFDGQPLLVMFICNHCPYVKHLRQALAELTYHYSQRGVAIVAIMSNDSDAYPDDAPAQLAAEARSAGYVFPYLVDSTQQVAHAFRAACTPDFYLFDRQHRLVYRGQFDDSRPGATPATAPTGRDLRAALDAVITGSAPSADQKPSIGCNIKWRTGSEPDYFTA